MPLQGARLATGEEPISVLAKSFTTRPKIYHEVEETVMFQLEFPSGARAACQTSFGIQMNHLHVSYEKGWLKMQPHSSYSGNNGSMSNGTIINFPLDNQQAKQMDEDVDRKINDKLHALVKAKKELNEDVQTIILGIKQKIKEELPSELFKVNSPGRKCVQEEVTKANKIIINNIESYLGIKRDEKYDLKDVLMMNIKDHIKNEFEKSISPVKAIVFLTGILHRRDIIAKVIAPPAEGPSLGVAASGQCICIP